MARFGCAECTGKSVGTDAEPSMAAVIMLVLWPRLGLPGPCLFLLLFPDRPETIPQRAALFAGCAEEGAGRRAFRVERVDARLDARRPGESSASPSPLPGG